MTGAKQIYGIQHESLHPPFLPNISLTMHSFYPFIVLYVMIPNVGSKISKRFRPCGGVAQQITGKNNALDYIYYHGDAIATFVDTPFFYDKSFDDKFCLINISKIFYLLNEWLPDWLTLWLTKWLTDRPTDRPVGWLIDWLIDWLNDWMMDWSIRQFVDSFIYGLDTFWLSFTTRTWKYA